MLLVVNSVFFASHCLLASSYYGESCGCNLPSPSFRTARTRRSPQFAQRMEREAEGARVRAAEADAARKHAEDEAAAARSRVGEQEALREAAERELERRKVRGKRGRLCRV